MEITSLRVTYLDDRTDPAKPVTRALESFDDHEFWLKPEKVDVSVEVTNHGKEKAVTAVVTPELYFLIEGLQDSRYPPLQWPSAGAPNGELKTMAEGAVWVWNRVLDSRPPVKIGPGQKVTVEFKRIQGP